tara:strand:+ start:4533 stop:4724 length:192 start_codon:yes stop_codon:yes gene_type:complete
MELYKAVWLHYEIIREIEEYRNIHKTKKDLYNKIRLCYDEMGIKEELIAYFYHPMRYKFIYDY